MISIILSALYTIATIIVYIYCTVAQVLVPNCSISLSQSCDLHRGLRGCQDAVTEGPGLVEVKLLMEQKRAVERELMELKSQLEKAGFSSLSQMRYSYPYNK